MVNALGSAEAQAFAQLVGFTVPWNITQIYEEFRQTFWLATVRPASPVYRILDRVALREQMPAIALSLGVLLLGLAPELLSNLSEAATTGLSLINADLS